MGNASPFLYLPDAVSLLLLWIVLALLRGAALAHLRLELAHLRRSSVECASTGGGARYGSAWDGLRNLIDSTERLAARLSPARLAFIEMARRRIVRVDDCLLADPLAEFERHAARIPDQRLRKRLRRLALDLDLQRGLFVLLGSLSGWVALGYLLVRVVWRLRAYRSGQRADRFVDFSEHLVSRVGRRAYRLAILTEPAVPARHSRPRSITASAASRERP